MSIELLLVLATSVLAAYLVLIVLSASALRVRWLTSHLGELFMRPFAISADRINTTTRRDRIEKEIDRELGRSDPWGRRARMDIIEATLQAQRIKIVEHKFRTA